VRSLSLPNKCVTAGCFPARAILQLLLLSVTYFQCGDETVSERHCEFKTATFTAASFYNRLNLFQRNNFDHPPPDGTIACCLYFVAVCQRRAWLTVCLFDPPVHLVQDLYHLLTIGIVLVLRSRCFILFSDTIHNSSRLADCL
jgi:hypothetical protein